MFGGCYSPTVCIVWCDMAASSLFISSQNVAGYRSNIEKYGEVSVECSSGVVRCDHVIPGGI